jgi:hypothetical protein
MSSSAAQPHPPPPPVVPPPTPCDALGYDTSSRPPPHPIVPPLPPYRVFLLVRDLTSLNKVLECADFAVVHDRPEGAGS